MKPPWLRTIPYTTESPSPPPRFSAFVDTKGMNSLSTRPGGIPTPVSLTRRST